MLRLHTSSILKKTPGFVTKLTLMHTIWNSGLLSSAVSLVVPFSWSWCSPEIVWQFRHPAAHFGMFWFKNSSLFSKLVLKWTVIIYLLLEINTNWAFTYWFWSWTRYNWQSIVIDQISRGVQLSIVRFPPRSLPRSATLSATIYIILRSFCSPGNNNCN